MSENKYQIQGIYDSRTLEACSRLNIQNVIFDFRPRSFNFLQKHLFESILKESSFLPKKIGLLFDNEKIFIIKDILEVAQRFYKIDDIELILFGEFDIKEISSLRLNFFANYNPDKKLSFETHLFCGWYFDSNFLNDLYNKNLLSNWINNFYQLYSPNNWPKFRVIKDWDSDFFESIQEILDIEMFSFPINNKIEVCYRNVNIKKLEQSLSRL